MFMFRRMPQRKSFNLLTILNHNSTISNRKKLLFLDLFLIRFILSFLVRYDFFRRTSLSGLTSPMASSMHSEIQAPTYASDMRILMENMQALNVNHRQDELLVNSTSLKEKEHRSMIPVRHHTSHMYHSRTHQAEPSDVGDPS